jgi:hypothetical protein
MTAVIDATILGYLRIVEALVRAGADVNHTDNKDDCALSWAGRLSSMSIPRRELWQIIEDAHRS